MDYQGIQGLIREMSQSKLDRLEIETSEIHIKIEKWPQGQAVPGEPSGDEAEIQPWSQSGEVISQSSKDDRKEGFSGEELGKIVASPMVGVFYAAASPESAPLVKAGDQVKKGQILCIIEAMKLMNEIVSEYNGRITAVLGENGEMVEFGQPLFQIDVEG